MINQIDWRNLSVCVKFRNKVKLLGFDNQCFYRGKKVIYLVICGIKKKYFRNKELNKFEQFWFIYWVVGLRLNKWIINGLLVKMLFMIYIYMCVCGKYMLNL